VFRRDRNFAAADEIRQQLTDRGIAVEDVAGSGRWRRTR
jgi:cysteinyl-tRNA synthetase